MSFDWSGQFGGVIIYVSVFSVQAWWSTLFKFGGGAFGMACLWQVWHFGPHSQPAVIGHRCPSGAPQTHGLTPAGELGTKIHDIMLHDFF